MVKRIFTLFLMMLVSMLCVVPVFATDLDVPADDPMELDYEHINSVKTSLSISGGTAYVGVTVNGRINHTTRIEVTATLQKKSGNKWVNVKTWNQSENSYLLRLNKTKAVSKGTYRVKNTFKAYHNSSSETKTKYSEIITR